MCCWWCVFRWQLLHQMPRLTDCSEKTKSSEARFSVVSRMPNFTHKKVMSVKWWTSYSFATKLFSLSHLFEWFYQFDYECCVVCWRWKSFRVRWKRSQTQMIRSWFMSMLRSTSGRYDCSLHSPLLFLFLSYIFHWNSILYMSAWLLDQCCYMAVLWTVHSRWQRFSNCRSKATGEELAWRPEHC